MFTVCENIQPTVTKVHVNNHHDNMWVLNHLPSLINTSESICYCHNITTKSNWKFPGASWSTDERRSRQLTSGWKWFCRWLGRGWRFAPINEMWCNYCLILGRLPKMATVPTKCWSILGLDDIRTRCVSMCSHDCSLRFSVVVLYHFSLLQRWKRSCRFIVKLFLLLLTGIFRARLRTFPRFLIDSLIWPRPHSQFEFSHTIRPTWI